MPAKRYVSKNKTCRTHRGRRSRWPLRWKRSGLEALKSGKALERGIGLRPAVNFGAQIVQLVIERVIGDLDPPGFRPPVAPVLPSVATGP